jgi:serine/threonine protein kinase
MPIRVEPQAEPIPGYRLLERLGGGGFGEVWKAEAPGGLLKAIKIVHGDMEDVGGESQKADQELRALRRVITVRHPYILSLERFDIVDGRLLIVMELADRNLADRAKECRAQGLPGIPREELLRYAEETAEALDLMNVEFQLQHLDIKPQNLFLVHNHVKVADFGLVKDLQNRMAATITGGVTPVYAAPETFDGWVSRFCDQYSLAIVYQELLTGQRPFTATNVHQLVMQHVQGKPNLDSLAQEDRPIISRALAKNPDERFPSCMDLVRALRGIETPPPSTFVAEGKPVDRPQPTPLSTPSARRPAGLSVTAAPPQRSKPAPCLPESVAAGPGTRSAPPVSEGAPATGDFPVNPDGELVPALVIGLGYLGLTALEALARQVRGRFGAHDALPNLRLLGIDSDPQSVPTVRRVQHAQLAESVLSRRDVLIARLNRAGYYLNPRNGRTRIDDWFDMNLLFRIPREPATGGLRALGRLAFFGNYRTITARLHAELSACTDPRGWAAVTQQTGLSLRTNQPRVYVVTSLGGGTGSGMFLDLAYVLRCHLEKLGHPNPTVVGVLLLPSGDTRPSDTLGLANAFAAWSELSHFSSQTETGYAAFTARYDEREGAVVSAEPPFNRCFVLPVIKGDPTANARLAGEVLALELTTRVGQCAEAGRPRAASGGPTSHSPGMFRWVWPRRAVLRRAAQGLCRQVVERWVSKDGGKALLEEVRAWVDDTWNRQELGAESLIARFQEAGVEALGKEPEAVFQGLTARFLGKGHRLSESDGDAVRHTVAELDRLLGQPSESSVLQRPGLLDEALKGHGERLGAEWQRKIEEFTLELVELPGRRLAGAEAAMHQCGRLIEQILTHREPLCQELTEKARKGSERLHFLVAHYAGIFRGRRDALLKELAELLTMYPKWRYQAMVLRRVLYLFTGLRGFLSDQVREIGFCRLRLRDLAAGFQTAAASDPAGDLANGRVLYPEGCGSLDAAVAQLAPPTSAADLTELDVRMQEALTGQFDSLRHVCTTPSISLKSVENLLLAHAEEFISERMAGTNVVDVYLSRHSDPAVARDAMRRAFEAAAPAVADGDVPSDGGQTLIGVPAGQAERLRPLAAAAVPAARLVEIPTSDDLVCYREAPRSPEQVAELLGPDAEDAYRQVLDSEHVTPHSRIDITQWCDVTVG